MFESGIPAYDDDFIPRRDRRKYLNVRQFHLKKGKLLLWDEPGICQTLITIEDFDENVALIRIESSDHPRDHYAKMQRMRVEIPRIREFCRSIPLKNFMKLREKHYSLDRERKVQDEIDRRNRIDESVKKYKADRARHIKIVNRLKTKFKFDEINPYLSNKEKAKILFKNGAIISEISDILGVAKSTALQYARSEKVSAQAWPAGIPDHYKDMLSIFPHHVVSAQYTWDRCFATLRAHRAGSSYRAIGDAMDITRERVKQLVHKAMRLESCNNLPPIGKFLDEIGDYVRLAKTDFPTAIGGIRKVEYQDSTDW